MFICAGISTRCSTTSRRQPSTRPGTPRCSTCARSAVSRSRHGRTRRPSPVRWTRSPRRRSGCSTRLSRPRRRRTVRSRRHVRESAPPSGSPPPELRREKEEGPLTRAFYLSYLVAAASAGVHDDEDDRNGDCYENCPENKPARPAPAGAPPLFWVGAHAPVLTGPRAGQTSGMEAPRWWTMRRAHSNRPSTYRCPFCGGLLHAMSEHMVIAPEGDVEHRRHAHTQCVGIHSAMGAIAMLMTREKKPSVTMISGRVATVSTGLITALTMPSTAEPIRYAAQPWMRTPSHSAFAAHNAAALI